jgi:hypothetical protein
LTYDAKVVITAFYQWRDADRLGRGMRAALGQISPPTLIQKIFKVPGFDGGPTPNTVSSVTSLEIRNSVGLENGISLPTKFAEFNGNAIQHEADSRTLPHRHSWTLSHSYYACMGGFAIASEDPPEVKLQTRQPFVLNESILRKIAKFDVELVPDISETDIRDKDKANIFTKAIACLQAFWFCFQCLFRLRAGLPISLLELKTLANVVCLW